jgi:tetratricopeptide (TPR) repeat protein
MTRRFAALAISLPLFAQSGRVITETGDPPPKATVERICNGNLDAKAETGRDGYFRFSNDPLPGCIVRAIAGSARSLDVDLKRIPGREIGTIVVHPPRTGRPRNTVSVKALATPESAKKQFANAAKASQKGKWDEAVKHLEKATAIYPDYAAAWMQLGLVRERQGAMQQAAEAYSRAAKAEPNMVQPQMRLMILAAERPDWNAVRETSVRVIALRPRRFGMAYLYNAQANILLGRLDEAAESLRIARELDPSRNVSRLELVEGALMERRGDKSAAIAAYQRYLASGLPEHDAAELRRRIQELEKSSPQ